MKRGRGDGENGDEGDEEEKEGRGRGRTIRRSGGEGGRRRGREWEAKRTR